MCSRAARDSHSTDALYHSLGTVNSRKLCSKIVQTATLHLAILARRILKAVFFKIVRRSSLSHYVSPSSTFLICSVRTQSRANNISKLRLFLFASSPCGPTALIGGSVRDIDSISIRLVHHHKHDNRRTCTKAHVVGWGEKWRKEKQEGKHKIRWKRTTNVV